MSRLRGWAQRGARLAEAVPGGHWHIHTLVHAVALDGMLHRMADCHEQLQPLVHRRALIVFLRWHFSSTHC
jgi:hypothetical protein